MHSTSDFTNLTPWRQRQVVSLRDELKRDGLTQAVFAADLYDVLMNRGFKVYRDPYDFFSLTYPTVNLRELCRDIVWRLAGKSDRTVQQLELTYGGGKTHTLITLYHLVNHPEMLPDLPAVQQFTRHIEVALPRARIVVLPFDKLDALKGMEIRGPQGETRTLKHPWSLVAYQIAGDDGLRYLHENGEAEEREIPPAENLLTELLALPQREGLATLILIDELLMYVRSKVGVDPIWRDRLIDFFQYLTQAATKVSRCAMVASLLATDPLKSDTLGKDLTQRLYSIFRREKEKSIQPVEKEEVAEILRRRFFTPESINNQDRFRPHVTAAYQGIAALDEQSFRKRRELEERLLNSYPFHPDLTEVLYGKWTHVEGFQRTRGVLKIFALALQEAVQWDDSPLISANIFLSNPAKRGLSLGARELTSTVSHEEYEGKKYDWSTAVENELNKARDIQAEYIGLKHREVEQAVFATFLHSQPLGQYAALRDLYLLIGHTKPDRIDLEKALKQWINTSWYLDEKNIQEAPLDSNGIRQLPERWRLGPRPNLLHMHHDASLNITRGDIEKTLIEKINDCKSLTEGAQQAGAHVHKLPQRGPKDVDDNTEFHYVILWPAAASLPNAPSEEAQRYINFVEEPERPRVSKNFVLLVAPAKDILEGTRVEIQKYLGWLEVERQIKGQDIDPARLALLRENKTKALQQVAILVRQMYNIVIAMNETGEIEAFKLQRNEGALFDVIKNTTQARIKLDPIAPEALLPGSPYDLWKEGDQSHQLSYLVKAFAKYPRLPRLLKIDPIEQTIFQGCKDGIFVLRIAKTKTTYWRQEASNLAESVLKELEVVLPEYVELSELRPELLAPGVLPALWKNEQPLRLQELYDYFVGGYVASIYDETYSYDQFFTLPKASQEVVDAAVRRAVRNGTLWLLQGETSLYKEEVPAGILTADTLLQPPPQPLTLAQILPAALPNAWQAEFTTADVLARELSLQQGQILPWTIVSAVLDQAFAARILDRTSSSRWPCDIAGAKAVTIFLFTEDSTIPGRSTEIGQRSTGGAGSTTRETPYPLPPVNERRSIQATLEPLEVQNLGNKITELMDVTMRKGLKISVLIEFSTKNMSDEKLEQIKDLLKEISPKLQMD